MRVIFAAETTEQSAGIFGALGIDLRLLIIQAIAFLVLVALLGKFVYPFLIKSIDDRRETIEQGLKEARASHEALEKAESRIETLLAEARNEADQILARSHQEATAQIAEAENKAKTRADQIVKDAHTQLQADIAKARIALKKDTAQLVALATERIIHEKIDTRKDAELIDRALSKDVA